MATPSSSATSSESKEPRSTTPVFDGCGDATPLRQANIGVGITGAPPSVLPSPEPIAMALLLVAPPVLLALSAWAVPFIYTTITASWIYIALYFLAFGLAANTIKRGGTCTAAPSLLGRVAIVTGGNQGIGKTSAIRLAELGATVILACRDMDRAKAAVEDIKHGPLLAQHKHPTWID